MTTCTFDVRCPDCGVVELQCDQLWLVLAPAPAPDHIAFYCPVCGALHREHAGPAAVALLGGLVAVEELDIPAEALERHAAEPLAADHLIELMLELERWTARPPGA